MNCLGGDQKKSILNYCRFPVLDIKSIQSLWKEPIFVGIEKEGKGKG